MTPINPDALVSEIRSTALRLAELAAALAEQLVAGYTAPSNSRTVLKRSDNRLTEGGIDALYKDFVANTLSNKKIAEKHRISLSGVLKRKAMWRRGIR